MIRPATLADVDAILVIADMEVRPKYPHLNPDKKKMQKALIEMISSAKHFCWVSFHPEGRVTGAIIGAVNQNMWAQRQCCNIPLWVSDISGDGVKLLQELKNWITSRRAIKVAGFAPDTDDIDPRVWKLASMLGFKRYGGAYLFYN
jgi:hypothetical protein